jgi:hypothetical protein
MILRMRRTPLFTTFWKGLAVHVPALLRVRVPRQEQKNWCWAAVASGVSEAYTGAAVRQCVIASGVTKKKCCPNGSTACDKAKPLPAALGKNYRDRFTDPAHRTPDFVKSHIDTGYPLGVRIHRRHSGSGHFVVISGYLEVGGELDLYVCDPQYGTREPWRFDSFLRNYEQGGYWHHSYETTGAKRVPAE